jgi:sulfite reductase (ferredoxin)
MEMDDFRRFRLNNGIYGIRNQVDKQMVRIKVPFGKLTPEQLEAMADVTETFAPSKIGHFTTRQNLQIHMVPLEDTPKIMRRLAEAGVDASGRVRQHGAEHYRQPVHGGSPGRRV